MGSSGAWYNHILAMMWARTFFTGPSQNIVPSIKTCHIIWLMKYQMDEETFELVLYTIFCTKYPYVCTPLQLDLMRFAGKPKGEENYGNVSSTTREGVLGQEEYNQF